MDNLHVCPELENTEEPFIFKEKCPITTCQYHTVRTKRGCLSLDRKESADRTMSPREIFYYKLSPLQQFAQCDYRQIEILVKKTQSKARLIIVLHAYLTKLSESDVNQSFEYRPRVSIIVDSTHSYLEQTFSIYRPWMLLHLIDEETFSESSQFYTKSDLSLGSALLLTPKKFDQFCSAVRYMSTKT